MASTKQHECAFPEIEIGSDAADGTLLKEGDKVLAPCACGEMPGDAYDWETTHGRTMEAAFTAAVLRSPVLLFHWSPARHRKQITRHGLRPHRRPVTTAGDDTPARQWRAPYVCFADSPSWA